MTDNHNYETPQKGATEWHESLNRNFRYIDRDIEIRDIDAAKTDYRPKSGAKFLATDTEDVYVGDGDQWLRLATSGQSPSFDTVSAETVVDRNSGNGYSVDQLAGGSGSGGVEPPVDTVVTLETGTPTAYRADGTQIAQDDDASAVVQSALDEATSSNGRGNVKIGSGSYNLQSDIQVPSSTTVSGAGIGVTVFNCTGPNQEWIPKDSSRENIVLRDFTQDGNDQGGRTGINMTSVSNSRLTHLEVLNAGGRDGSGDSTPALRITGGTRSRIDNCRVRRSSSVSIEAAIGAVGCEIVDCIVQDGVFNSGAGFVHGISIEKSENCKVEGCYVEGTGRDDFSPALNINNADYALCVNNTVRNVGKGLLNANGPCRSNVYANNTFLDCFKGGLEMKGGNAGAPTENLVVGNVFENCGIRISSPADGDVMHNLVRNGSITAVVRDEMASPPAIIGNVLRESDGTILETQGSMSEPMQIINNYIAEKERTDSNNEPVVNIRQQYGIMANNIFNSTQNNKSTVSIKPDDTPSYWMVSNNYFDETKGRCLQMEEDGYVTGNIFDGGEVTGFNGDLVADVRANYGMNGASLDLSDTDTNDGLTRSWSRSGTYTGDGTTGRTLNIAMTPDYLIVEGADGTLYDVHTWFGAGFQQTAPSDELSISDSGFTVGSVAGNTDLNVDGESYLFYAR